MQAVLVMFRSDGERRSFSVTRDVTVIGRREDCDLRIPLGDVSRKHCRLVRDGDTFRVEDLGSSNGTFHNGQRVQEAAVNAGDSVQVGPVVFVLQLDGVPADDELAPVVAAPAAEESAAPSAPVAEGEGTLQPAAHDEIEPDADAMEAPISLEDDEQDDVFDAVMDELQGKKKNRQKSSQR